jgi:hypothetical protein
MFGPEAQVSVSAKRWVAITAIIGYALLFFFLLNFVGLESITATIQGINIGIYLLALCAVIIAITFHAMVWYKLLRFLNIKLSFRRTYILSWLGIFIDNLVPSGWSGDLFKAYWVSRDSKFDRGKVVASVVAKNVLETVFALCSMILGLVFLLLNYSIEGIIFIGIGGVMTLITLPLIILLIISFYPKQAKKAVTMLIGGIKKASRDRLNLSKFQPEIEKLLDNYHEGIKILASNPKMMISPVIYSFFALAFEILTLYLVFASLGFFVPAEQVIIVRSIVGNVEGQGYAFAGYAQVITTTLYPVLGVLPAIAASVGLLGGIAVFWLKTVIAYFAFHCTVFARCTNRICNLIQDTPTDCKDEEKQVL